MTGKTVGLVAWCRRCDAKRELPPDPNGRYVMDLGAFNQLVNAGWAMRGPDRWYCPEHV